VRILAAPNELQCGSAPVCLAIGFFDGVHLGHQQILRQTLSDARQHEALAVALTFDVHPNTVVAPTRVPPLIYSRPQCLRVLAGFGPDALLVLHFDKDLSLRSGEDFITWLARELGRLRSICVGANFVFGHKRSGNVELLRRLGGELNFTVHEVAAVSLDGKRVSSTRIRERIAAGDLDAASQMLGRPYSLSGQVVCGDGMGRQLGFPTANLDVRGLVLPPNGVYAVHAHTGGKQFRAVLNVGQRPTLQSPNPRLQVEAHLLEFQCDLYGQELEVGFVERLRDEQRFNSLTELRAQIAQDIRKALQIF
jgi:riboflavin kinase/FMN adenylyltransferase